MAEKAKKVASRAKSTPETHYKKKRSFPLWLVILPLLAIGAFVVAKKMGTEGGGKSASSLKMVEEVDADDVDQWSYANGYAIGKDIQLTTENLPEGQEINKDVIAQAINDVLSENETKLSEEQVQEIYQKRQEAAQAEFAVAAEENKKVGEEYIKTYKSESGVKSTPAGVAYKVLESGDASGEKVGKNVASVLYTGKRTTGEIFDSTADKGENPILFASSNVVKGMGELLESMRPGDKYEMVIPSDLAYGPNGKGPIGPNETIIFELEIVEIMKEKVNQQAQIAPPTEQAPEEVEQTEQAGESNEVSDEELDGETPEEE